MRSRWHWRTISTLPSRASICRSPIQTSCAPTREKARGGGAGSGASGFVQSTLGTGTPIDSFDPIVTGGMNIDHATFPESSTVLYGVQSLQQHAGVANFSYTQGFGSGTLLTLGFTHDRITSNSGFAILSPEVDSGFRLTLRQHLLAGFGFAPNLRFIHIARNNREISDVAFRGQVIA